ncbi:MAG: hypothetical protein VX613_02025 [Candidatus Thermoplasmatota archaeon]|nr:hypothetical protein [Candidatus Thermoplasmatota archaeon]
MARPTEQRILEWLNQYDELLETAWDVPRECSLPGIADAIGVVRSALHKPLKNLLNDELIIIKQAHVINGGTRKRNVHFITEKGRKLCNKKEKKLIIENIQGNPPNNIELIGREYELGKIDSVLTKEKVLYISGIAGIGKTAILRYYAEQKSKEGMKIKWYSATSISSPKTIVETWLKINKLSSNINDLIAIIRNEANNNLLIIDNFDQIQTRFKKEVEDFIAELCNLKCQIIISSRPPLPKNENNNIEVHGLNESSAKKMLDGFDSTETRKIVEYFDGHPLGLIMVNENMSLESTKKGINAFLENEILAPLTKNNLDAILELAIQPEPIEINLLSFKDEIADLDQLSLITFHENKIQLHNFVKNLLISQMDGNKKENMHSKFVKNISNLLSYNPFLRLYHEINSKPKIKSNWVVENAMKICIENPAKSSALFHEIIQKNENNEENYWFAAICECELGNGENAENLLEKAKNLGILENRKNDVAMLDYRIARLSGKIDRAEEIRKNINFENKLEHIQYLIADMSRNIDDRIPNQIPNKKAIEPLKNIKLNSLNNEEKRSCLIAIAIIKHTFSLYNKEFEKANEIRNEIKDLTSKDSEILKEMNWKDSMISGNYYDFETKNLIRNIGLICWRLEFENTDKINLLTQLKTIIENNPEIEDRPSGRRSIALYWTWLGILDESKRPFAWTQAIGMWNSSECYNASKTLQNDLHKWLKETGRA